jgi:hypothetical protein
MKKLLIIIFFVFIANVYASGYLTAYVDNDNQSGTLTPTLGLNLSSSIIDNLSISNTLKYYYNDSSFQQWQQFDVPEAKYFTNQWLDNNIVLNYNYGNTGLFTAGGYRMYEQLDIGNYSARAQFTNGYNSNLTDKVSQSTYFTVYQYTNDGSYKLLLENDLHYKYDDVWSVDTQLSTYRYANTKVVDNSYNLDGLLQVNYNFTKQFSVYSSQELVRNLVSNSLVNTTEVGMSFLF